MSTLAVLGLCLGFGIPALIAMVLAAARIRFMSDEALTDAYNQAESAFNDRIRFVLDHYGSRYTPDSYDRSLLAERNKYRDEIARREARRA